MLPQTILAPGPVTSSVDVAPVHNALASLSALSAVGESPGLAAWTRQTAEALEPERRRRNLALLHGIGLDALVNAVPIPAQAGFPAYLESLAAAEPEALRDRLLRWALTAPRLALLRDVPDVQAPTPEEALADGQAIVDLFAARTGEKELPEEQVAALRELHDLLVDPVALHAALVEHLGHLWRAHLRREWARIEPTLQQAVAALSEIDTTGMTVLEAIRAVSGRDLSGIFRPERIARFRRLRLIPSLHTGPYTVWSADTEELRLVFGARAPAGRRTALPELDRVELLHGLKAMADDTRLALLATLAAEGELPTAALQERFDLSSSAASRHLRQLVATGLITERRDDGGAKRYRLAPRTVDAALRRLRALLTSREEQASARGQDM